MSDSVGSTAPTKMFWVIAGCALLWNVIGIATYLMSVTMSPDAIAQLPEAERALREAIPAWATGAYAIGVFGGALGSIGLLVRKGWATPLFTVSLLGILAQMGHAFFLSDMIAVLGMGSVILPLFIIAVAVYLVQFSRAAHDRGLIG